MTYEHSKSNPRGPAGISSKLKLWHIEVEHDKFSCKLCLSVFSNQRLQDEHMIKHHQKPKPFICQEPYCNEAFLSTSRLAQHLQKTHAYLRPYFCQVTKCDRTFKGKLMLREHVRLIHHNSKVADRDSKKTEESKGRSLIDVDQDKSNHIEIAEDNSEAEFWRPWE